MKLEVGKKYTDGIDVVEVKFLDYEGTAWCLSNRNYCKYIHKNESDWREVVDKPDPGEGWRLLDPCEDVEAGDEYYSHANKAWLQSGSPKTCGGKQGDFPYRRRIAPQYVPYTWDDRDELRGRWYRKKGDNVEVLVTHLTKQDSTDVSINSWWSSDAFLLCCEWLDGTPCGKKVV